MQILTPAQRRLCDRLQLEPGLTRDELALHPVSERMLDRLIAAEVIREREWDGLYVDAAFEFA